MNILRRLNPVITSLPKYVQRSCTSAIPKTEIESEEVTIPVPGGHISCVHWGPKDKQPILALHGWQDNAGTWKRLIPLLNNDVSILAIDFPGHGKSSWFPHGVFYHGADNLITIRKIVSYFGWKSVALLGHSMGAIASFLYATHYPNETDYVILLDNLKPITKQSKNFIENSSKAVDALLKADKRNIDGSEPPSYPLDELIERHYLGSHKSIDKDKCPTLLERAIAKSSSNPERYYFTRDSKLKYVLNIKFDQNDVRVMAKHLHMPVLNIKFENGPYFEPAENYLEIVNILKEHNDKFEIHYVPGSHHAHVNNPELVAPLINDFLRKYSQ